MSEARVQIKEFYLEPEVHEALKRMSRRDDVDLKVIVERAVTKFVLAELHRYTVSHEHFQDLRILKNLQEFLGKND